MSYKKYPFLIGKRVILRALCEKDADGNYPAWLNDQEICYHNSHARFPYGKEQCLTYINRVSESIEELVLAVILKESDKHIGNVSIQNIDYISRSAEFAILMGERDYWGRGYAYEAAKIIVEHAFNNLNLNRIYCGTSSSNHGMQKLALKLGMQKEGSRREAIYKNGQFNDIIEYGILKSEFKSLKTIE